MMDDKPQCAAIRFFFFDYFLNQNDLYNFFTWVFLLLKLKMWLKKRRICGLPGYLHLANRVFLQCPLLVKMLTTLISSLKAKISPINISLPANYCNASNCAPVCETYSRRSRWPPTTRSGNSRRAAPLAARRHLFFLPLIKGKRLVIQKQGNKSGRMDLDPLPGPQLHSEPRYVRRWFFTAGSLQSATAGTRPFLQEIVFFFLSTDHFWSQRNTFLKMWHDLAPRDAHCSQSG